MKALRYLLITIVILTVPMVTIMAQHQKQQTQQISGQVQSTSYDFRSTSSMPSSGSTLAISALSGVTLSGNAPGDDTPADGIGHPGKPRRATMEDDPFGGGDIGDINKPEEPGTPVGDGVWVMMLMAMLFGGVKYLHRKQALNS